MDNGPPSLIARLLDCEQCSKLLPGIWDETEVAPWLAGFDRAVLEQQEREERERKEKQDRKRDRKRDKRVGYFS